MGGYVALAWSAFRFLLHLSAVYLVAHFCVAWIAGQMYRSLLPLLQAPTRESSFEFLFNHAMFVSVFCGLVAGIVTSRYSHREALLVWIVPSLVLAYRFVTFPSTVFESHSAIAFHHYFGGGFVIPEFHSYKQMFESWSADMTRGLDQMQFTVPAYVGISYSIGGWIAKRFGLGIPDLASWLQRSGEGT